MQFKNDIATWTETFQKDRREWLAERDTKADTDTVPIQPSGLFNHLRQIMPDDAAYTMDAGTLCLQATDAMNYKTPPSLFTPLILVW